MQAARRANRLTLGWLAAALIVCLTVFVVNRGPLYYHDTADYLNRGGQVLKVAGIAAPPEIAAVKKDRPDPAQPDATNTTPPGAASGGKTADVSRSVIYAVYLGLFAAAHALEGVVLLNAMVAVLSIWLPIHVARREFGCAVGEGALTLIAVAMAVLGSLSFYVAFLMPDIFTPALLLVAATLTAFAGRMTRGELVLAGLIGAAAAIAHTSHLVIALALLPVVAFGALLIGGPRRWLAPGLMAAVALVGVTEHEALRFAIHKVEKAETVYLPFLTARMIQDGPGRSYLAAHCPSAAIPTCTLWQALSQSSDPMRFTASHVTFERSQRLGSFRLMPEEQQRAVANGQVGFFLAVLRDRPLETAAAVTHNVLRQLTMNSIDMTLPDAEIRGRLIGQPDLAFSSFASRLAREDSWIPAIDQLHDLLYLLSLGVIVAICIRPATPPRLRVLLLMGLAGIFINALICGAVSQPATRYGARVIWLLPALAAIAGGLTFRQRASAARKLSVAGGKAL